MGSDSKRILIADDEQDILEIMTYNLQLHGYEVACAKDGDEAIQKAKDFKPELIILDIMMPKKMALKYVKYLDLSQFLTILSSYFLQH